MKNKVFIISAIIFSLIISINIFAKGNINEEDDSIYVRMHPKYADDFKTERKVINVFGETRKLYKTFVYPEKALNAIYEISKDVLDNLKDKYHLPQFNKKTVDLYHQTLFLAIEEGVYKSFLEPQVLEFDVFMDTWENDAQNQEIISLLQERTVSKDFLELLMPYEYGKEIETNEIPKHEEIKPNIEVRKVGFEELHANIFYYGFEQEHSLGIWGFLEPIAIAIMMVIISLVAIYVLVRL